MENKILTLQEKMVRIRARIPSLVKQAYSEEVSYDFIKIDDIFRYLTPAMNEYGVNFDIISRSPKRLQNLPVSPLVAVFPINAFYFCIQGQHIALGTTVKTAVCIAGIPVF